MKKIRTYSSQSEAGFTLLEVIIVTLIVGILSAISAPSWFAFVENQRLLGVEEEVYRAVKETQATALREKGDTQISFREITVNGRTVVQYVIHDADDNPTVWNDIDENITLNLIETTIPSEMTSGGDTIYPIEFNYQGEIPEGTTPPQRLVIQSTRINEWQACLSVQTLLGALIRNCP